MDQFGGWLETLQIFVFHFLWSCTFDENLKSLALVDLEFLMGDCSLELQRSAPVKEMYLLLVFLSYPGKSGAGSSSAWFWGGYTKTRIARCYCAICIMSSMVVQM